MSGEGGEGEVAVVTGAARGIGLATTRRFVGQGMRVAMVDRDGDVLHQAAEEFGDAVQALVYDVSIPQLVAHMAAQIEADFGACHALINNAGVADFGPITETTFNFSVTSVSSQLLDPRWPAIQSKSFDC